MNYLRVVAFAMAIAIIAAGRHVAAQLPSESMLPGARPATLKLPHESALPEYVVLRRVDAEVADVPEVVTTDSSSETNQSESDSTQTDATQSDAAQTEADQSNAVESNALQTDAAEEVQLPNEGQLPAQTPDGGGIERGPGGGLPVANSPDGIPWLRLNLSGHTAPTRTLIFSRDGKRLFSAGDDKTLVAWRRGTAGRSQQARWAFERAVRWQIQRGNRGRVHAVSATPEYVAMAGVGAMGGAGEILLIDPQSGDLKATLNDLENGHRQVVIALGSAEGAASSSIASLSMDGCLVSWSRSDEGLWRATRVRGPDGEVHANDPELVARLLDGRRFSAVAAVNDRTVIAPAYVGQRNNRTVWRLQRYDVSTGQSNRLMADDQAAPHWDHVTAMAVGGKGNLLVSADGGGYVYLWDLRGGRARLKQLTQLPTAALSLSFDESGDRLAIGTFATPSGEAFIETWNVAQFSNPRRIARIAAGQSVQGCALSPDGQHVAWTDGPRIRASDVNGGARVTLNAGASAPLRVAFPQQRPYHRIGISKQPPTGGTSRIDHVFDTSDLRLDVLNQGALGGRSGRAGAISWLPDDWLSRDWDVRTVRQADGSEAPYLFEGQTRRARVPLREVLNGAQQAVCWIPSRTPDAPPVAAAIGTSDGGIYLVEPAQAGVAPIVRQFRGHTAAITSLAVSRDLRFLASASLDGTVRIWPLKNISEDGLLVQRWGAEFEIQDGQLLAVNVRPDGPAYFRGIRSGDRITELRYVAGNDADDVRVLTDPQQMRAALSEVDWNTLMSFEYVRGRAEPLSFQILPSWQQLATLFVADDGQWAYWAPAGYYDASFEGHKLFGWQINRGLSLLPDFFLAAQFRRQLERPRVMSQLLRTGSLEAAFEAARLQPPADSAGAIVNAYRLKPKVEILSPRDDEQVGDSAKLRAAITVESNTQLVPPRAFANGVPATNRRLVSSVDVDGQLTETYEWDLALPSDRKLLLQVLASTDTEITETDEVVVSYDPKPRATKPRLRVLSVGVDKYQDAQIPKLTTAVQSTRDLFSTLQTRSDRLYELDAASLLDDHATRPSWRYLTTELADSLREGVSPDDLLVIFLSGHGVQSTESGYQFITADARYADVLSGNYSDCLSFSDLSVFAEVPCRKLVILNTCHGGSIQPLMHREMKNAVRELQHDLLITLAASGGEQEAIEGRFTRRMLEALSGAADVDSDGVVRFDETVAYVQRTVAADSSGDAVRQMPVAGPSELLPYLNIDLSAAPAAGAFNTPQQDTTVRHHFAVVRLEPQP